MEDLTSPGQEPHLHKYRVNDKKNIDRVRREPDGFRTDAGPWTE